MRSLFLLALAVVLTALAIYVWRARAESSVTRPFALFTFALGGWVLGIAGVESGNHTEFWGRFTFVSASFIAPTLLAFARVFPATSRWPSRRIVLYALFIGGVWALLSATTTLVAYDINRTPAGIHRTSGRLYPAFVIYFLLCAIPALGTFVVKWKNVRGLARAQLQHLAIGLLIGGFGAITTNLLIPAATGRSPYSWLGPFFALPLVLFVGHAIIRHRLMDLRIVIDRSLAYSVAIAMFSAAAIYAVRWTVPESSRTLSIQADVLIILVVVLSMLSAPAQRIFSSLIDPYLYRGRIEYSSALRQATHRLSHLMQPSELAVQLRGILNEAFVPESFTMVARPLEGGTLEELSTDSPPDADLLTVAALMIDAATPSVLVVNPALETGAQRSAHEALRFAGIEIVITLGRRGQTLGAVLLGPRRGGDAYFTRDLSFIESLAELASIALENSLLYRQRIQMLEYSDRLLESLDSAVIAVDVDGKITSFNSAARALVGLRDSDRGALLDILPSEIGWSLAFALAGAWRREVEASIDHESRGALSVILSTAALHNDRRAVAGALAVVTDISTVKSLEKNQRRVEHLATMARFYAGIAHEIRSPLAAISNFISMLPDRFDDPEYRDTAGRLLPIEVGRIVRLADRLRLMAPSEDGKLGPIALSPLLNDIAAIHAPAVQEHSTRIVLSCPEVPKILGDAGQLVQLFVNILRNAVESMPTGGTVSISVSYVSPPRGKDLVTVRVIDEGSGIDSSVRTKIFQPFFTTKPSGTGLGLSICQEIADFHRARLTLIPRADRSGTVAQIEFPALHQQAVDSEARALTMSAPMNFG